MVPCSHRRCKCLQGALRSRCAAQCTLRGCTTCMHPPNEVEEEATTQRDRRKRLSVWSASGSGSMVSGHIRISVDSMVFKNHERSQAQKVLTSRPCQQGKCVRLSVPIPGVTWAARGPHEELIVAIGFPHLKWRWSWPCAHSQSLWRDSWCCFKPASPSPCSCRGWQTAPLRAALSGCCLVDAMRNVNKTARPAKSIFEHSCLNRRRPYPKGLLQKAVPWPG